jgi:catechol 2,3-dioxygenase-like lactoylglutathione lyase family enzyme
MKYQGVCIVVSDINTSRQFYEDLFRLEVIEDYGTNIAFNCGISLQQDFDWMLDIPDGTISKESKSMELYFEEDDFNAFLEKLSTFPDIRYFGDGVKEQNWGQRTVRFYDPDSNIIEVGENLKEVAERFLASGMTLEETSKRMDISLPDLERLIR